MMIYIVEDDADIRELESYALQNSGFDTRTFANAAQFYQAVNKELPDLVLMDIMMPGESGLDALRRLRSDSRTAGLPVILVTAKTSELDLVRGLDMGADDYITKPFGVMELVSRVKARTRRTSSPAESQQLSFRGIRMDLSSRQVTVDGALCELTYKEFELLRIFLTNPRMAIQRDMLMEKVWGYDYDGSTRTLDMHIKTLRQKLGAEGSCIQTVRSVGYRLTDENL